MANEKQNHQQDIDWSKLNSHRYDPVQEKANSPYPEDSSDILEMDLWDDSEMVYDHSPESYAYAEEAHSAFGQPPEEEEPEAEPLTFREILFSPLPTALSRRVFSQYLGAICVMLFGVFLTIYQHDPRYLIAIAVSGGLVYMAISTSIDFINGRILELAVICSEVNELAFRNKTLVVFRTNDTLPRYFEFTLPGKRGKDFRIEAVYFIYFDPNKPHMLLGFMPA